MLYVICTMYIIEQWICVRCLKPAFASISLISASCHNATEHRGCTLSQNKTDLYTTFVDLTKAFDTFIHSKLGQILSKFDSGDKFVAMVRQFHNGMQVSVHDDGEHAAPFPVENGIKQGCVLAPTLFSMAFTAMLGSTLSKSAMLDEEVAFCVTRANAAFGGLQYKAWNREDLSSKTELNIYRAVVLPSLLFTY